MAKPKLRRIRHVVALIDANPETFDMKSWASCQDLKRPCETTACFAGWADWTAMLEDFKSPRPHIFKPDGSISKESYASAAFANTQNYLGLTEEQAESICFRENWWPAITLKQAINRALDRAVFPGEPKVIYTR